VSRHIYLDHSIVGAPQALIDEFRRDRPFTFCRICGRVFQPGLARISSAEWDGPDAQLIQTAAEIERREWSQKHARTHTSKEHRQLERSGRFLTPEATFVLAPFGIAPLGDMVLEDDEVVSAAAEAPRAPVDAPETTLTRSVSFSSEKGVT
jgi:hypothetical protein